MLAMRGTDLLVWRAVTPSQAHQRLIKDPSTYHPADSPHLADRYAALDKVVDYEDEDLRQLKKIRSTIQVSTSSVLREQLDSILPYNSGTEKYRAAFEIVASHVSAAGSHDGEDEGSRTLCTCSHRSRDPTR